MWCGLRVHVYVKYGVYFALYIYAAVCFVRDTCLVL